MKKIMKKKGFHACGNNKYKKEFYGLATTRQAINYAEKIRRELFPSNSKIISLTDKEIIIKVE